MKLYYHVSRDIENIIRVFKPQVPSSYLVSGNENRDIKRVCLAEDFMDCMNAISYIRDKDVCDQEEGTYKPLRVYKFELDEQEVVQPEEVHQYVHDALKNKECWSLKEITPIETFILRPTYIAMQEKWPTHIGYMDFDRVDENMNVIG